MLQIKLAEHDFTSGVMRCIGMWCDAKLDGQSQIFTILPILLLLWWERGILVTKIPDKL